jgi:hypothetical protein
MCPDCRSAVTVNVVCWLLFAQLHGSTNAVIAMKVVEQHGFCNTRYYQRRAVCRGERLSLWRKMFTSTSDPTFLDK